MENVLTAFQRLCFSRIHSISTNNPCNDCSSPSSSMYCHTIFPVQKTPTSVNGVDSSIAAYCAHKSFSLQECIHWPVTVMFPWPFHFILIKLVQDRHSPSYTVCHSPLSQRFPWGWHWSSGFWLAYLLALEMIWTPMMMWEAVWGSLETLMHFNKNPGKPQLKGLWEHSSHDSPALWQLIVSLEFITPNSPSIPSLHIFPF